MQYLLLPVESSAYAKKHDFGSTSTSHQDGNNNGCTKTKSSSSSSFSFKKVFLNKNLLSSSPSFLLIPSQQPGYDICPISFYVLPFEHNEIAYKSWCKQLICDGCIIDQQRAQLEETGHIILKE